MGLFDLFRRSSDEGPSDVEIAEDYLRSLSPDDQHITALVRHYNASAIADSVERFAGALITDAQAVEIVERLRAEFGMPPMDEWNRPGFVDPGDYPADQADQVAYNASRSARDAEIEAEQSSGGDDDGGFLGRVLGKLF